MIKSPNLQFDLLMQNQSQKEITVNSALLSIDSMLNNCFLNRSIIPPIHIKDGDAYLLLSGCINDWKDKDGCIAYYYQGGWKFVAPKYGCVVNMFDGSQSKYNGSEWLPIQCKYLVEEEIIIDSDQTDFTELLFEPKELKVPGNIVSNNGKISVKGITELGKYEEELGVESSENFYKAILEISFVTNYEPVGYFRVIKKKSVVTLSGHFNFMEIKGDVEIRINCNGVMDLAIVNSVKSTIYWPKNIIFVNQPNENNINYYRFFSFEDTIYCMTLNSYAVK